MTHKWFQIHLSTAILLMLVAALITAANFCPNVPAVSAITLFGGRPINNDSSGAWVGKTFGFPLTAYPTYARNANTRGFAVSETLNESAVLVNVLFGAVFLFAIFKLSEHLSRRREARNP
jgi:hypothetical protein